MLYQAAPQSICARQIAMATIATAMPSDARVRMVRRRLVSEGGASPASGSPRTSVGVTAGTVPRDPRSLFAIDSGATGPRSRRSRRAAHPRQQWTPRWRTATPGEIAFTLREDPRELIELGVLVTLARRAAVPLTYLIDPLERRIWECDGSQLGRSGLDDAPDAAVATEERVGPDRGFEHWAVDEVERRTIPPGHLRSGGRRFRIAHQDLADRAHRKKGAFAVLVDRADLRLEDGEIERDLWRLRENHFSVDEI